MGGNDNETEFFRALKMWSIYIIFFQCERIRLQHVATVMTPACCYMYYNIHIFFFIILITLHLHILQVKKSKLDFACL
uniref:Uncharacterized protein n=1 Tax=Daphnia magna TaxID=35525 RepID=A0A0P5AHT3_9CRUS